jgi:maltose alpha-D-glucosyltransferase/alpha-amylase
MRSNIGIRRRLAPLLGGDRRRIELLHGLLLSLPGSPTLYYGDEIAMGDTHVLDDRDGVRTPMQWDPSPGAGFSSVDPSDLYLPLVDAAGYSPSETNVADQRADPGSLLNWVRSMLHLRRRHPAFGVGDFTPVAASDPAVLSFLRTGDDERILVAANVSDRIVTTSIEADGQWEDLLSPGTPLEMDRLDLDPFQFRWLAPQK